MKNGISIVHAITTQKLMVPAVPILKPCNVSLKKIPSNFIIDLYMQVFFNN